MKHNKENQSKKNTVLVVDDEEMNLRILKSFLCEDYDVLTAASGAEALDKAFEETPDLILLDVMMPEMDGYEVLKALKKDDRTWRIPVIFITGLDSKEDEEKGLAMDASDYISKPFSVGIVRLRVKNQIQIVNQIRTIESLSLIDQLTGIPNRRNLDNRLKMEWTRAYREKQPLSIMMMDIDKFKMFNDTYGHLIGDDVLKLVAASFEQSLKRKSDFAARFGGEEFSILLPNTPLDGAVEIAECVRERVQELVIPCGDGKTTKVTLSIGIYSSIPTEGESISDIIEKADQALYKAKETGRNRVCVYCAPEAAVNMLEAIGSIDEIDIKTGLAHFNNMEQIYIETVEFFAGRLPVVSGDMEKALEEGDIKKFTISVHSMKSMLSTVGASNLSRMAEQLEAAGKSGDIEQCKKDYPALHEKLFQLQCDITRAAGNGIASGTTSSQEPETSSIDTPPKNERRKKIIHLDDVNYTLVSLKGRLENHFEVFSVRSYEKLINLLDNVTPDLILLDLRMPGMDGFEIISELKARDEYKNIPVVFFTSVNDDESVSKCKELGAADVLIKPISDGQLISRLTEIMG